MAIISVAYQFFLLPPIFFSYLIYVACRVFWHTPAMVYFYYWIATVIIFIILRIVLIYCPTKLKSIYKAKSNEIQQQLDEHAVASSHHEAVVVMAEENYDNSLHIGVLSPELLDVIQPTMKQPLIHSKELKNLHV